jgi:hypothetical protein
VRTGLPSAATRPELCLRPARPHATSWRILRWLAFPLPSPPPPARPPMPLSGAPETQVCGTCCVLCAPCVLLAAPRAVDVEELLEAAKAFWDSNSLEEERLLFPSPPTPPQTTAEAMNDLDAAWGDDEEDEDEGAYADGYEGCVASRAWHLGSSRCVHTTPGTSHLHPCRHSRP